MTTIDFINENSLYLSLNFYNWVHMILYFSCSMI